MISRAVGALGIAAMLSVAAPAEARGQDVVLGDFADFAELSLTDLLDVTVSIAAGRIQSLEDAPGIVSVITAEDIRRLGAMTLADVLQTVPGFDVTSDELGRRRFGVRGVTTDGVATSENLLILMNGVRLNDQLWAGATSTHFSFPVQNLKQIEVIRGPGSALFGSNAFVGVINLVTWDATSFYGREASVTAGAFGTTQVVATASELIGDLAISGSFQFREFDGYDLSVSRDGITPLDEISALIGLPLVSRAPGVTEDSSEEIDAQLRMTYGKWSLDAIFSDHSLNTLLGRFYSLDPRGSIDSNQGVLSLGWSGPVTDRARLTASVGGALGSFTEFTNPIDDGFVRFFDETRQEVYPLGIALEFGTDNRRLDAQFAVDYEVASSNTLTVGAAVQRESSVDAFTTVSFDPISLVGYSDRLRDSPKLALPEAERTIFSAFVQDTWDVIPQLGLTAGVRFDHYDDFGNTVNPRLGVVWRMPAGFYFKGLYGRAYRAPSFAEMGFGFEGSLRGNEDLQPSTINTLEAALSYRGSNIRASANYFATFVRDFISAGRPISVAAITTEYRYDNFAGLDVQGFELEFRRTFGFNADLWGNYTYQNVTDLSLDGTPGGVAEHMANVGLTTQLSDFVSLTPVLRVRGDRARFSLDPRDTISGYTLLDINTRLVNIYETLELSVNVRNLLDESYVDPAALVTISEDLPRPGRHLFISASYKF